MNTKKQVEKLLKQAGIQINGPNDFDLQVFNKNLYSRLLSSDSLGLGEAYMDKWWDVKSLDKFFYKVLMIRLNKRVFISLPLTSSYLESLVLNLQNIQRSFVVGKKHYDIGNDLYEVMLGKTLAYSCGYWKNCHNLDDAQIAKFDLICRKIGLKKGDHILDVGCGWGSFLKFAVENYGVKGTGITVSKEQFKMISKSCKNLPIEVKLDDYRTLTGKFDHIVSVGMFEHVGLKNYRTFMLKMRELLKDDGLFLLHTIGSNTSSVLSDAWLNKYIFPNGKLPSINQISKSIERLFIMEDWHNFGTDYDKTLMAWFENFDGNWPFLKIKYSDRFYRMWKYYLLSCAGSFRARKIQLWQIVLSKNGILRGYNSVR